MLKLLCAQKGVTLIELMIGISIVSMLMMFALPSYQQWIQNVQIRTAAESIQNGLQLARAEAVRRNAPIQFQLTSASRLSDWKICLDAACLAASTVQQRNGAEGSANARVGVGTTATAFATPITTAPPATITFTGLGRITPAPAAGASTRIDVTSATGTGTRRLVLLVSAGGKVRMCDPLLVLANNPQGCG